MPLAPEATPSRVGVPTRIRGRRRVIGALVCASLATLAGCRSAPPAAPLDEVRIASKVSRDRTRGAEAPRSLTLAEAVSRVQAQAPAVLRAEVAWQEARARARVKTPPPNPRVGLGPLLADGVLGVVADLGWSLVLSERLQIADRLDRLQADEAYVTHAVAKREAWLELRAAWIAVQGAESVTAAIEHQAANLEETERALTRRVEAGTGNRLDLGLLATQGAALQGEALEVAAARTSAVGALASLLNWRLSDLEAGVVHVAVSTPLVPTEAEIMQRVLRGHGDLDRLRAAFCVAEKRLRLVAMEARPDLDIGLEFEREDGASRFALPLGWEVPIWDRGQKPIAAARAARERARAAFELRFREILVEADVARAHVLLREQDVFVRTMQAGTAREALEATEAVAAGGGGVDSLRLLEVRRALRESELALVRARSARLLAWTALERACGVPLLRLHTIEPAAAGAVDGKATHEGSTE